MTYEATIRLRSEMKDPPGTLVLMSSDNSLVKACKLAGEGDEIWEIFEIWLGLGGGVLLVSFDDERYFTDMFAPEMVRLWVGFELFGNSKHTQSERERVEV